MRYMCLLYIDESQRLEPGSAEAQEQLAAYGAFTESAQNAGKFTAGDALQPSTTATVVRANGAGSPVTTDGPFAETKEQLGGFYILDCANLDEAVDWAARIPAAKYGAVEVRPIVEFN